jgi:hypothetical protein
MTTTTKIIIGVVVASAVIGGAYYFYKKRKAVADDMPKVDTKTTTGEYVAKDDERFGKGLGVLALPKKPIPTNTTTNTSTPNFTKGIF